MPQLIIIICTALAVGLLLYSHSLRFYGMYHKKFSMNPLTPLGWLVNNLLGMVFLLATNHPVLFWVSVLSFVLDSILLTWSVRDFRRSSNRSWTIKPSDYICFGLAIVAATVYALTNSAVAGALIAFGGSILVDIPQLRKALVAPYTDSTKFYIVPALRLFLLMGTLQSFTTVGLITTFWGGVYCLVEAAWLVYCKRRWAVRGRRLATVSVEVEKS